MLSIQQAGVEILGNKPRSLYFLCGSEYGVKQKYIDHLKHLYSSCTYVDSISDLVKMFSRKSLVSSSNSLYVVRYDAEFVKSVDSAYAKRVLSLKVPGCLIAVYDDEKQFHKLDKHFPDNTVYIQAVTKEHCIKYLKTDYSSLDDRYIKLAAYNCFGGYGHAKIVCSQMNSIASKLHKIEDTDLLSTFGIGRKYTEQQMMLCAAARSFEGVMTVVDNYDDDLNFLLNGMCHVAIELDKAMDSKMQSTEYSKYVKLWTRPDVYNFFEQCYVQTLKLRSSTATSAYSSLVYVASLLNFKHIPSVAEVA